MTPRKQELSERLQREFDICDRHIKRINEAIENLGVETPIDIEVYENLDSNQIRCIDQFIFRFSKLQDAMGAKIFRHILEYLDEDVSSLPMRDILNMLERYSLLPDANEWTYIRELRNETAHDYPLFNSDVLAVLNELFSKTKTLMEIYENIKSVFESSNH